MNQKRSLTELVFLTILPALLLLCSTCYLPLIDRLQLSPYLMLCLSGIFAVISCLLWGSGLTLRLIRRGSAGGMALVSLLLTLWSLLYLLSGILASVPYALYLLTCFSLVPPALLPAALFRTFHAALQPADKQKPGRIFWILFGIGAAFGLFALSDPLHHLVFPVVSGDLTYGIPLYVTYGWFCIASIGVQIYLLANRFSVRAIPALLLAVLEAVAFLLLVLEFFDFSLMTMAYAAPLLLYGFCALAISAELMPDGRDWPLLLQHSTFPVQLMDTEGTILCGSDRAAPLAPNHKAAILNNRYRVSQIMDKDTQLSASLIPGGFALHQKDLRDLHALQDALDAVTAELNEATAVLAQEQELEANLQRLTKQNDFFSEQAAKIQEKTDRAALLLRCAAAPDPEPGFRRTVVTRANVLVTYIQQLGHLLQAAKETDQLPVRELRAALEASAQTASAAGTRCRVYNVAQGTFPADVTLALYDLAELILEDVLISNLPSVEIRLRNEQSGLRLVMNIRDTTIDAFTAREKNVLTMAERLGAEVRVTERDGVVSLYIDFVTGGVSYA